MTPQAAMSDTPSGNDASSGDDTAPKGIPSTSSWGSEPLAGKNAIEPALALRATLRALGVPRTGSTIIFYLSVKTSGTNLSTACKKKHHDISYHMHRSATAAEAVSPHWIEGKSNPSDFLTKALSPALFHTHSARVMTLVPKTRGEGDRLATDMNRLSSFNFPPQHPTEGSSEN